MSRTAMRRKRLTREESRARTRELVLDSAAVIFRRDGFHQASIDEIAEEAGFSRGAVYSSFSNKEEFFLALHHREAQQRVQLIAERIIATDSLEDAVRAAAHAYYERHLADPGWSLLMTEFAAHAARHAEITQLYREQDRQLREASDSLIVAICAREGIELSPAQASEAVAAMLAIGCGISLEQQLAPETIQPELIEDLFMAVVQRLSSAVTQPAR